MSVPIDPTAPPVTQRHGVTYASASLLGEDGQPAHRRLSNGTRKVEPVERLEKSQATDNGRLREERPEPSRDRSPGEAEAAAEVAAQPAVTSNSYDRKLSYDADVNRVYLDIVNTKDDEVLLRLPSENTAKYLEQVTAQSDEKDEGRSGPRFQEIA